jgi:hypothetical protein
MTGAVVLSLVVACTGSTQDSAGTMAPAVTTTAPTSSTLASSTSATTQVTTTTPPTMTQPDGPSGSGCTPGDAVALPEGEWYGLVVTASASAIEFDLACWFTGDAAVEAAAEDGEEPPPNDYYVRNDNPQLRSIPVSPDVEVIWYPTGDPTSEVTVTFAEWVDGVIGRGLLFGVWIDVIDGEVFSMREQWVP